MASLRLAFRTLAKAPVITAVAVLSLALGIGANGAVFSLFDRMVLRSLPAIDPGRLVNLAAPGPKPGTTSCDQAGGCEIVFGYPMFRDLEARAPGSFVGIAAHRLFPANLAYGGVTTNARGALVSGSYFPLLGIRAALGRLLTPDDDRTIGAHFVTVLSHRYWRNQLGADPNVLNRTLVINGQSMTVVGVAAPGFEGTTPGTPEDVFVPITMRGVLLPGSPGFDDRRNYWVYLFGRLTADASIEQAGVEINTIYGAILNGVEAELQYGMSDETMAAFRSKKITVTDGRWGQSTLRGGLKTPLTLLFVITAVVLLIACANIANLLLAWAARRSREMAICSALGATRRSLIGQQMLESCLLALVGGLAGLVVAHWTLHLIRAILPTSTSDQLTLTLEPAAVWFTGVLAIGTGVLFGAFPALHATRRNSISVLKEESGRSSGARSAARVRNALVTAQIGLSMTLLVAAGMFVRSLANVSRVQLGIETDHVVTFSLFPILNGYDAARASDLFAAVERELAETPGVTAVSAGRIAVLTGASRGRDVRVLGFEPGPDADVNARYNAVGATYFRTLGMPLVAGREFTTSDDTDASRVAIVNEAFARKFGLGGTGAVGAFMSTGGDSLNIEIVGLVMDAKYDGVKQAVSPQFFLPYRQEGGIGYLTFYARTSVEPGSVLRSIGDVVRRLDPDLPIEGLKTLDQQVRDSVAQDRVIGIFSAAFALLATLLAAVGLYGVVAYSVAQRTREIGLRMALGAQAGRVRNMVLWQVGRMTAVGGVVGIVAAFAVDRIAQSLLFEMQSYDALVVAVMAALLSSVAIAAGYAPALRASKVDPVRALRYE